MMVAGISYLTLGQLTFVLCNYVMHATLGRQLGPELYGIFGVINAFVILNEWIFLNTLPRAISKFIAEHEEVSRSILRYALKGQMILGIVLFIIYFALAQPIAGLFRDPRLSIYIRLLSVFLPISALALVYTGALNGMRWFKKQAIVWGIFSIARLAFVLFFIFAGYGVEGAIGGFICASLLLLIISRRLCKRVSGEGPFEHSGVIKLAIQIVVLVAAGSLLMNIDFMSVKIILRDDVSTGLYAAALTLARIPVFAFYPVSMVFLPLMAKSISEDNTGLSRRYVNQSLRCLLLFLVPLAFLVSATSREFLYFAYGSKYVAAMPVLSILIFGLSFLTLDMVINTALIAMNKAHISISFKVFLVVLDIFLNITLIRRLGLQGAAIASTITTLLGCVLSGGYVLWCLKTLIKPASLARIVLAGSVLYIISSAYSPSGVLLLMSYFGMFFLFLLLLFMLKEIRIGQLKAIISKG